jgi:hypothetical protein
VARDIDPPQIRFYHGCSANPNHVARVINAQAVQGFLQIIAEQRILHC